MASGGGRTRAAVLLASCALALACATAAGSGAAGPGAQESIVGGGDANAAGWSFAVALRQRKLGFICTGSLIAPAKVLTAAHCVIKVKPRHLSVLVDSPWSRGKRAGRRLRLRRVKIDPHYDPRKDIRDLAVLTLKKPAASPPIALPTARESAAATRAGRKLRSAGWGARSVWGFRLAQRLKSTREQALANRHCQRSYTKKGFNSASMICALGAPIKRIRSRYRFHATTCSGDSGGPLVAETPAGSRLVGVTSAGPIPCGYGPSIYARVSAGLRFINRAVAAP
jgi:trypsin